MIHVKTFGPDGSYPRAVCGAREPFTFVGLIRAHDATCPECRTITYTEDGVAEEMTND